MITKELVERINYLARKQRNGGLTEEEKEEQKQLREIYLKNIRSQVIDALEAAGFKPKKKPGGACSCGHCSPAEKEDGGCNCGPDHGPRAPKKLLH
ncbi:MAG: DUF896 domain-containing protein [Peptococcaceae bacterium]|nr:DUF896 domain-containing protein [Peptococcaceae bacterium]